MANENDDARLVGDYLTGNERAFRELYARYERPLFSFILKFLKNRQDAEDVFQQTWIKAMRGLKSYQELGKFSSWLFGIANNCCIDSVRKIKRQKIDALASSEGLDLLKSDAANPETGLIRQEEIQWLSESVADLPLEQRQVVLLRVYGDLPFKEIAAILKSPLNTVLGRMHYAVKNLQKMHERTP